MKVIDIINEAPLNRDFRSDDRSASTLAGATGAAATAAAAADHVKGKSGKTVSKDIGAVKNTTQRFVRRYRGDAATAAILAKILPQAAKKTALKSIPLAGWLISGYFAGQQLAKGDVTGAGLELVSGLGNMLTAIPMTAVILARDCYDQAFMDPANPDAYVSVEQDYAKDQEGTTKRLEQLTTAVRNILGRSIDDLAAWSQDQGLTQSEDKKRYLARRKETLGY